MSHQIDHSERFERRDRLRAHHTSARRVRGAPPEVFVHGSNVQVEPSRAGMNAGVQWHFGAFDQSDLATAFHS